MRAGQFNERITFEKKSVARDAAYGSEVVTWVTHADAYADVQELDAVEQVINGVRTLRGRSLIKLRWLPGVLSDMRIRVVSTGTLLQITSVADMRKRIGMTIQAEEYSA
jgi:SPP1 family predicted phage head-tail adaptor